MINKKLKLRVIMIGPSPSRKGGIAAVARHYLNSELVKEVDMKYISSTTHGTKLKKLYTALYGYLSILFFLSTRPVDLIHILLTSHISFYRKIPFMLLARIFRKKIILHIHASNFEKFYLENNLNRYLTKIVFDNVNLILVLSETTKKSVGKYTVNKNIKVLYNPISSREFSHVLTRKTDPKIVLFMGEIGKRKGVYDLLEAIPKIVKDYANVKFVLCGDGELEKVKDICSKKNIEKNVDLLGYISGREKINYFEKANIYILPSYHEGLPVSILEAMASGLPIISTPVAGIPEAVENGVNGFLINPGDSDAIVEKVTNLLKDEKNCTSMGRNNVEKVKIKFDTKIIIKQLMQNYELVVNDNFQNNKRKKFQNTH